jgi:DNA repair protein RecN (Recombination protein N)
MQAKLQAIEAGGERIAALERTLAEAKARYDAAATALREQRRLAAQRLDAKVAEELAPLKLDSARFRTALSDAEAGP